MLWPLLRRRRRLLVAKTLPLDEDGASNTASVLALCHQAKHREILVPLVFSIFGAATLNVSLVLGVLGADALSPYLGFTVGSPRPHDRTSSGSAPAAR